MLLEKTAQNSDRNRRREYHMLIIHSRAKYDHYGESKEKTRSTGHRVHQNMKRMHTREIFAIREQVKYQKGRPESSKKRNKGTLS